LGVQCLEIPADDALCIRHYDSSLGRVGDAHLPFQVGGKDDVIVCVALVDKGALGRAQLVIG